MTDKPWAKPTEADAPTATPAAAPTTKKAAKSVEPTGTATVVVGCKLPSGLILELIPPHEGWNPPPAGPRIKLNGANSVKRDTLLRVNPRILDYGRTMVSKDFWDQWFEKNKNTTFVTKGFIFAESTQADFRAHAKEALGEKTGLEGLNPEGKDDRLKNIQLPGHPETKIESDAAHLKRLQDNLAEMGSREEE